MDAQALIAVRPSYRKAGWAAIPSGVIGIAAFGLLMTAVTTRVTWIPSDRIRMLFNSHDVGVVFSFSSSSSRSLGCERSQTKLHQGLARSHSPQVCGPLSLSFSSYSSGSMGRLCRTAFTCFHKGYSEHGSSL